MKEMTFVLRLFIACRIITFRSGRGAGGKQHRKSVQEHFIDCLPSH